MRMADFRFGTERTLTGIRRMSAFGSKADFAARNGERRRLIPGVMPVTLRSGHGHSALMLAVRMTLPHFSVSSATNLPKSAGEPASAVAPHSARRAATLDRQARIDRFVERADDLGRQAFRRRHAGPEVCLVSRHGRGHRRDVRQCGLAGLGRRPRARAACRL